MENINDVFNETMNRICGRCFAHSHCDITKTKCAEYEMLSAIRDEVNSLNDIEKKYDELVADIKAKEEEWLEKGICPYCKQELPNESNN